VKVVRYAAVAVVVALAAWSAYAFAYRPLVCHRLKQSMIDQSYAGYTTRSFRDLDQARLNLTLLEPCFTIGCRDLTLMFTAAVNYRTLGRNEVALGLYQEALRYEQRPEIYGNIADTYLALGNREAAYENYLKAVFFHPEHLREIGDGVMRRRVRDEVLRRYPEQKQFIEYIESPRYAPLY
jgi:tetratricopeptide (TPR) repeat protein